MKAVNLNRRMSIAAAAVLLAVPALSACGFNEQTDQVYNPADGVNNRSGAVDVLDALIVADSHGSGTVIAGLSNNNQTTADQLTSVSGAGKDQSVAVTMGSRPTITPAGFKQLADLKSPIAAKGSQIVPGNFVTLRFTFKNAESITVDVPVLDRTDQYTSVPVPTSPSPSTSPSASPTKPKRSGSPSAAKS